MELLLTTIRRKTSDRQQATVGRAPTARNLYPLESIVPACVDWPVVTPCRAPIGRLLDRSTHHARSLFLSTRDDLVRRCSFRLFFFEENNSHILLDLAIMISGTRSRNRLSRIHNKSLRNVVLLLSCRGMNVISFQLHHIWAVSFP